MRLLVARHGETRHNAETRFTGQMDAPLSALGARQADALAARLAPMRFDAVVTSDLARAAETARRIAARRDGQPVVADAALREIAMGAWEGLSVSQVMHDWPDLLERIERDPLGEASPPHGESWAQFSARVLEALARWRAAYPQGSVLWVAHGGVVSALLLHALGLSYERRYQFARGNTGLFEFDYRPSGVVILRVNDTSHLDTLGLRSENQHVQAL